jgi:CRP-like cAMP-binding protein
MRLAADTIAIFWGEKAGSGRQNMKPIAENPLTRKLRMFTGLSSREVEWLDSATSEIRTVIAGQELVRPETIGNQIFILQTGWAYRYKALPDGRRQVLNFVLPGDFIGLRANFFGIADHSTVTLTAATVSALSASEVGNLFKDFPKLAAAMTWSAAREEAMLAEQIVRLGRRNALESMAHLFLELLIRLKAVDVVSGDSYAFPITQQLLADTLGLSIVHVNRTLRKLRTRGLVEIEAGRIFLRDIAQLERLAAFEDGHIALKRTPPGTEKQLSDIESARAARKIAAFRRR